MTMMALTIEVGMPTPFTNNFTTVFPDNLGAQVLYSANMIGLGLASFFAWSYAAKGHRLVDSDLDPAVIRALRREALSEPTVAALAIAVAFPQPVALGADLPPRAPALRAAPKAAGTGRQRWLD